ncbi:restriction endonuclease subunit S, partial [Salmonella enterica subsp. enterica serovar Soerenga]
MAVEKLIVDHIDTWTTARQTRSTTGRGSSGKIDLYGIKKLRELILELAVRGKLVPQDPNDEPASVLLKRIAAEKAELVKQGKIKKQKPLPEISEEEKPFELPVGWEWVRLGEISDAVTGNAFKTSEYSDEGTFVLRVTNINPDGSINLTDSKFIPHNIAENKYSNFSLVEGDILLVMVGGSLGKIGIVDSECLPAL